MSSGLELVGGSVSMKRAVLLASVSIGFLCSLHAADIQGVLADWKCTERMVKDGRAKTLKQDGSCSLVRNPARDEYGLITSEKHFYRLDKTGSDRARKLLQGSHHRDNLRVIVRGDVEGDTVIVKSMSLL
jgi:hypothetical protein